MSGGPAIFPVVSLELAGMRASVKTALNEYLTGLKDQVAEAVDRVCTPEHVKALVDREVASVLNSVVRDEVERFYRQGNGRETVRQVIEERLGGDRA